MRILLELRPNVDLRNASVAADASVVAASVEQIRSVFEADIAFAPIEIPQAVKGAAAGAFSLAEEDVTYVVRGEMADEPGAFAELSRRPDVQAIFADPAISTQLLCPGDPPSGTAIDVGNQLGVQSLHAAGATGKDVHVAVCDTGINQAHLQSKGLSATLDAVLSFQPIGVAVGPGQQVLGGSGSHGTMCAYDTAIAAPDATLLDHSILLSQTSGATVMSGLLSDALRSFSQLMTDMFRGNIQRLVVNNSWGMFDPAWDFPPGHPGNYSDNPVHPFNIITGSLEAAGADIVFAAGNCGRDCPDSRCAFGGVSPVAGANSHPLVHSVAGVDVTRQRVGYSSQGPGRLSAMTPNICGYTHFLGSEAFGPGTSDSGTSAAAPVVAGVLAAIRSKIGPTELTPAQLRALVAKTAADLGGAGFDADHGWGVIEAGALFAALPTSALPAPPWPGRFLRYPPFTKGPDVLTWQQRMVVNGFKLNPDGIYGPKSKRACIELQKAKGLDKDGIVGQLTWTATWS